MTRPHASPLGSRPSRRDFLTTTAATIGASSLIAASLPAQDASRVVRRARSRAALADGEPLRIGVIGTGGMGTAHCKGMIRANDAGEENLRIVALSDVCTTRLEAALAHCQEHQQDTDVRAYTNYRDLLAREDIHGVLIASPEHWHADHAIDTLLSGKDVYVEKPMTHHLTDSFRMMQVLDANPDMILQIGTQFVMWPVWHAAKKIIADGGLGKPTFSQTSYCRNSKNGEWLYGIDEKVKPGDTLDWEAWCGPLGLQEWDTEVFHRWRRYKMYSSGIIGDLLVHKMTPLVMALDVGWPIRVDATGGHYIDKVMENHDQVNLTVQFEDDHTMIVAGSTCNDLGLEDLIRGHRASMYVASKSMRIVPQGLFADEVDEELIDADALKHDQNSLRLNWMKSIRTREPNISQIELATKIMVIVDLAARSIWEGRSFSFDPETRRVS